MKIKEVGLSWIVVKDIKVAVDYYTKVVGLKLAELNIEYGWAELEGHEGGPRIGLALENPHENVKAGQNAVITFTVDNLEDAVEELVEKGADCEGDEVEVPDHIIMQTMLDPDGNRFQLCELLHHACEHC